MIPATVPHAAGYVPLTLTMASRGLDLLVQASLERLDRGGTGKVRPGDFMAAVRQVRLKPAAFCFCSTAVALVSR